MSTTKETEPIPHSPKRLTRTIKPTGTIPENGLRLAAFAKALPLVGVVSRRTAGLPFLKMARARLRERATELWRDCFC